MYFSLSNLMAWLRACRRGAGPLAVSHVHWACS